MFEEVFGMSVMVRTAAWSDHRTESASFEAAEDTAPAAFVAESGNLDDPMTALPRCEGAAARGHRTARSLWSTASTRTAYDVLLSAVRRRAIGLIIALMEQEGFPGWAPMIGTAPLVGLGGVGVDRVFPDLTEFLRAILSSALGGRRRSRPDRLGLRNDPPAGGDRHGNLFALKLA